ncbi:MAG TPA: phosphoglycerate dehydrogenase [Thermoanaerobaculia bacterium]|nr:phosphoglycerate dehydrogenase [Thermoanaerobaculia bacterium]
MYKILIADSLDPAGLEVLRASGAEVTELAAEDRPRLPELLPEYDALVVRSSTRVTAELLAAGARLKVVGRAGIGVDNVDVAAATERGVLVVNAPTANLISATEHTFALLLALARRVPAANAAMKQEVWDRKSFVGQELQQKTLGVIGFGRIGQQVAARARAFEMQVVAHDPYLDPAVARRLDVEPLSLEELLARADVVTLHVPLTDETRGLLGAAELARMRPGVLLVNCARGGVVDEAALLAALDSGGVAGAAVDVFAEEPPRDWALVHHPGVIATPHIGAQTVEAQERIALETARMVLAALQGSLAISAVNLPFRPAGTRGEPFLQLGERLGRLASGLVEGSLNRVQVDLWGVEEALEAPVAVAVLRGALSCFLGEAVNYVNAETLAAARGIQVVRATHAAEGDYPHLVGVSLSGPEGSAELAGTFFADGDPRVVRLAGFRLEFRPKGRLLVLTNRDVPGVVGKLGTLLGEAGVNIAEIHLARRRAGRDGAMAVVRIDQEPPPGMVQRIAELPEVQSARLVDAG